MKKLRSFVFIVVANVVIVELLTRMVLSFFLVFDYEMLKYSKYLKVYNDSAYAFTHHPDRDISLMGVHVKTNSLGLRDNEVNKAVSSRYIFLGDSMTFGWGVDKKKTFEALVDDRLGEEIEVINFAHCNYNLKQSLEYYRAHGDHHSHDRVYYFHFLNDLETTASVENVPWWGYSSFLSLVVSRIALLTRDHSYLSYYKDLFNVEKNVERFRKDLGELKSLVEGRGAQLVVFIVPDLNQLNPYPFQEEASMVRDIAFEHHLTSIDLISSLQGQKPENLIVSTDDAHPNAKAHGLMAEAIFQFLFESR